MVLRSEGGQTVSDPMVICGASLSYCLLPHAMVFCSEREQIVFDPIVILRCFVPMPHAMAFALNDPSF